MAKVSLSQAAKDTGVSLPTLSRWRKKGFISANKNSSGGYILDTSEYDRIQELRNQSPNMKPLTKPIMKDIATPDETPNITRVLEVEVELLRERVKDKNLTISDLREERDDWKQQAQTLLLQHSGTVKIKPAESHAENSADTPHELPENAAINQKKWYSAIYFLFAATIISLAVVFWTVISLENQQTIALSSTSQPVQPSKTSSPPSLKDLTPLRKFTPKPQL